MANDHIADDRKKVRLIDADALRWKIGQVCLYVSSLRCGKTIISKILESYRKAVFEEIDNAPTVDAVEVVHAHWGDGCAIRNGKEVYKSIDCSECDNTFKTKTEEEREYWKKRFKVCPFCGAIMDGERRTE